MTWRSRHSSIHRSSHRSTKPFLQPPNLESCEYIFEPRLQHLEMDMGKVKELVLATKKASLFVSPSGKIYGGYDLDHMAISDRVDARSRDLQEAGFLRVYMSPRNDLSFHVVTKPTTQQLEFMQDLIEIYNTRKLYIIVRDYPKLDFKSVAALKEAFP